MNKILLSALFIFGMGTWLQAQQFVSTMPENKNVVLEEFTGIYCVFCPDGHVRANNFKDSFPNDVFLINIHGGSYANPGTSGDPDFRTDHAVPLITQSQLTGYPSGTINRRNFPGNEQNANAPGSTAQRRTTWATTGDTLLTEASPVNVAAEATIDASTRELTVVVETYFTAAGGTAPYKLNVALLQNNVQGPQTGAATFNPGGILANGNYNHQHMLRDLLTGQWGIDITSTSMGYFQVDTIKAIIPAGYAYQTSPAIPAKLTDLEVVVFVAEGQQEIVTGNEASMNLFVPPGFSLAEAALTSASTVQADYCDYNFTPAVTVSNNSTDPNSTIDTFEITYSINGGMPMTQLITGASLAPGQSTVVSFPQTQLGLGNSEIDYSIEFISYNSTLVDNSSASETNIKEGPYTKLSSVVVGTNVMTSFEGLALRTTSPANAVADNPDDIQAFVVNQSISTNATAPLGGFGQSANSFLWNFYSTLTGSSQLIYEKIDLTQQSNALVGWLKWNTAYAQYNGASVDRLRVKISTDCGMTWNTLYNQAGTALSTATATTNFFWATASDWRRDSVDISAYLTSTDVTIAFEGISDYGNSLFIDDIRTEFDLAVNVDKVTSATSAFQVFPNPVSNQLNVNFEVATATELNIRINNALGQVVHQVANRSFEGNNTLSVNTSQLPAGVYFIQAVSEEGMTTQRFVIER